MRHAAALHLLNQLGRHTQHLHTLPCGVYQPCIATLFQRQKFLLRTTPFRYQQADQRAACCDHITRRSCEYPFHEPRRARLHDGHIALVESQHTGGFQPRRQTAPGYAGGTHTQVLHDSRIDFDRPSLRFITTAIGIFRYQRHVHERRFTRLVEMLLGYHRVIPIQRLALGRGVQRRGCRRA